MREPSMNNIFKDEILKKCFQYFVHHGIESISMRKMCVETGMAMSSIYYWFGSKDNMILEVTEWGLKDVSDRLFSYVYEYKDDLQYVIFTFSEYAMKYKEQLGFIHQVATSKKYGNQVRPIANKLSLVYDEYCDMIAKVINCDSKDLKPYVYLFVSAVLDYVVWHDKEKMEIEITCIFKAIKNLINSKDNK